MKTITYAGAYKGAILLSEIVSAFPDLIEDKDDGRIKHIRISKPDDSGVQITVPDAFDKAALDVLVAAHDPTQLSAGELRQQRREDSRVAMLGENIKALRDQNDDATSIAKLRAINDIQLKIMGHMARMLGIDININGE